MGLKKDTRGSLGSLRLAVSDPSAFAFETDGYLIAIDDDRDLSLTVGQLQHLFQKVGRVDYIDELNRLAFLGIGLTGRCGVGSSAFPVNDHLGGHGRLLDWSLCVAGV